MSNQFNFKRFSLLFKKHTNENYKSYLLLTAVFTGILTVIIGLLTTMNLRPLSVNDQAATYTVCMLFAGTIFTSNIFVNLGDKRKAIATLVLPASAFEKFLVGWIYSYLIFQIVFGAVFYIILSLFLLHFEGPAPIINILSGKQDIYSAYLFYAFLNAITIYGAIYFKKMHFVKTAFVFFIITLIAWLCNDAVLRSIVHYSVTAPPFGGLNFETDDSYYNIDVSNTSNWIAAMFVILASCLIWAATYFRLKEKQI